MQSIVLYSTRTGNTQKVAQDIAAELNCPCVKITNDSDSLSLDLNNYDMVFIGTGIYKGQPHVDLINYLSTVSLQSTKRFALFLTRFGWGKEIPENNVVNIVANMLALKGQSLLSAHFTCFGHGLGFVKRGHPDVSELQAAKSWANGVMITTESISNRTR